MPDPIAEIDAQLAELGVDVAEEMSAPAAAAVREGTKRQALHVITMSLFGIGIAMIALLAFTIARGDKEMIAAISDATQPSTLLIAVVSSLGGLAAGAGLSKNGG